MKIRLDTKIKRIHRSKFIIIITSIILFFLPFIWTDINEYNLGGDDSRLYIAYPWEWIQHVGWWSWSGAGGFWSSDIQQLYLPINIISFFVKFLHYINIQKFLYGIALTFAFISVYYFLRLVIREKNNEVSFISAYIGGLFYIFSPLVYLTFWVEPVKYFFSLCLFPLLLYFFLKSVYEDKFIYLYIGGVISVVFSISLSSIPFMYAFFIGVFPFLFFYAWYEKKIIKMVRIGLIYVGIIALFNSFWIIPFISSSFIGNNIITSTLKSEFLDENARAVILGAQDMNIYDTLLMIPSRFYMQKIASYRYVLRGVYSRSLLSIVFLSTIILGIFFSKKIQNKRLRFLLIASTLIMLILAYFSTVHVGSWGVLLFSFLISKVPGFVSLRNYMIKLPQIYTIFYSIALSISVYVALIQIKKQFLRWGLIAILLFVIIIQAVPFIKGDVFRMPFEPPYLYNRNVVLSKDYLNITKKIKEEGTDNRVLHLPLSFGTWSIVKGDNKFGIYSGTPLTRVFGGKATIAGITGLRNPFISDLAQMTIYDFVQRRYNQLLAEFGLLNIKYIIYESSIYNDLPEAVRRKIVSNNVTWIDQSGFEGFIDYLTPVPEMSSDPEKRSVYILPDKYYFPKIYIPERYVEVKTFKRAILEEEKKLGSINAYWVDDINNNTDIQWKRPVDKVVYTADRTNYVNDDDNKSLYQVRFLPGSIVYPFILYKESLQEKNVLKSESNEVLANYYLGIANKRINEVYALVNAERELSQGNKLFLTTVKRYKQALNKSIDYLEKITIKDNKQNTFLQSFYNNAKHQRDLVSDIYINGALSKNVSDLLLETLDLLARVTEKYNQEGWTSTERQKRYFLSIPDSGFYNLSIEGIFSDRNSNKDITLALGGKTYHITANMVKNGKVNYKDIYLSSGVYRVQLNLPKYEVLSIPYNFKQISQTVLTQPISIKREDGVYTYKLGFTYNTKGKGNYKLLIIQKRNKDSINNGEVIASINLPKVSKDTTKTVKFSPKINSNTYWIEIAILSLDGDFDLLDINNMYLSRSIEPSVVVSREIPREKALIPKITFKRINPVRYEVTIEEANYPYLLTFLTTFHEGWNIYMSEKISNLKPKFTYRDGTINEAESENILFKQNFLTTLFKKPIAQDRHVVVNGYANGWYIVPQDVNNKSTYTLIIEYWPQRLFYLGVVISSIGIIGVSLIVVIIKMHNGR